MSFPITYRANGKLLLTGEYLVLHGAKAIALPLKVGQQLTVSDESGSDNILWKAYCDDKIWFLCELNPLDFSVVNTSHTEKAETLGMIFKTIKILKPDFKPNPGILFETTLEANPEWGFGSSSTLISLLAQWTGVDPFLLNELVFQGSGFDIACATAEGSIFFQRNEPTQPIDLNYHFADQLFLVYSGQKKKTANEVKTFLKEKKVSAQLVTEASDLADKFAACVNQHEFNHLIRNHEELIGNLIVQTPVKKLYFADFDGEIKSLGAWGGDFYLISTAQPFSGVKKYFANKGLETLFHLNDLILKRR